MTLLRKDEKCESGYELLTSRTPNGFKISIMLFALGVPFKYRFINLMKMEQKSQTFFSMNPNGRIPVLIDHDENGFFIWESGAILLYLSKDGNGKSHSVEGNKLRYKVMQCFLPLCATENTLCHQSISKRDTTIV